MIRAVIILVAALAALPAAAAPCGKGGQGAVSIH